MLCCVDASEHALPDDGVTASFDLSQDQTAPIAGQWQRLLDGFVVTLAADQSLADLAVGTYRFKEFTICLRARSNDQPLVGDYARSFIGMPSSAEVDKEQVVSWAEQRQRLNPVTLIVLAWRLADDFAWPWQSDVGFFDGLSSICARVNPTKAGFAYDRDKGAYVDAEGLPIQIDNQAGTLPEWGSQERLPARVAIGDVISAVDADSGYARFGILVADAGKIGFLDPNDKIVSAFVPPDKKPGAIQEWHLGYLFGQVPVHIYKRHRQRAESILNRYRPDNPIWNLSPMRQWLTLAGMVVIIIVLFRFGRKKRCR